MTNKQYKILAGMAQAIYDKKGANILAIDVCKISNFAHYFLLANGTVERHVIALAHAVIDSQPERPLFVEGLTTGDWIVLDYGDIMVHLFHPQMRDFYELEKRWAEGRIIDLPIEVFHGK